MTEITNPTLVTDVEKNPTVEEQERMVVGGFVTACSNGNLKTVIDQLKNKKIRDIMVSKENNFYITEALNVACKKNQEKFIEDFIFKREIMGLLGNINRSEIFKQACENGHTELVKLIISKKFILDELNVDALVYVFYFSVNNGYLDVIENLLNNEKIIFKIYNDKKTDPSSEVIDASIINENIKPEIRRKMIMLILDDYEKKQLINKDILNKLFTSSCVFGEEEIFDRLLTDDKLKNKIVVDSAIRVFTDSFINNKISFFKKIVDNDLLRPKLIKDYKGNMISIFVHAYKDNKREIIDILKTNEEIKNKILPNAFEEACQKGNIRAIEDLISIDGMLDKIKSSGSNVIQGCFQMAYIDAKIDVINTLINNESTRNEIQSEAIQSCFENACESNNLDMVKLFLENENLKNAVNIESKNLQDLFTNILTKEEKLNEKEIELSVLFLKNNVELPEKEINDTNYKKVKGNIGILIKKLKINEKNFKKIKDKDWNGKSNYEKTISSLEKIKDELGISQDISRTK